jgi:hypothetical protein
MAYKASLLIVTLTLFAHPSAIIGVVIQVLNVCSEIQGVLQRSVVSSEALNLLHDVAEVIFESSVKQRRKVG